MSWTTDPEIVEQIEKEAAAYARIRELAEELAEAARPLEFMHVPADNHSYEQARSMVFEAFQAAGLWRPPPGPTAAEIEQRARYKQLPRATWELVLRRDNWTCQTCGSRSDLTVDHINPRKRWNVADGDVNHPSNLQTLCGPCNSAKGDR